MVGFNVVYCDVEKDIDKIKCLLIICIVWKMLKKSFCFFEKYLIFNNCWLFNFKNFFCFYECLLLLINECENKFLVFMVWK